uniref:PGG domain-containing protein n=1 Tax=Aegilops tauschii subsp. strangulata TaxID=200361 RepID=A0A453KA23_AEGTS
MAAPAALDVSLERVATAPAVPPPGIGVDSATAEAEFLWELRKYVLLLATLAASVTYSAGLSPPGGFWPDNDADRGARLAGDPVLLVTYPRRYKAFFYCNATAFVASLVIVNLLLVRSLGHRRRWLRALQAAMLLDQFGLMGAYAAGSCRDAAMSAYVFVLVALVACYVSAHVLVFVLFAPKARGDKVTPADRVERARKYLLIFATLAATITYQAGVSTPGGFWPGSQDSDHLAGDPMLRVQHPSRFMVFFYSNTTAFVASLVVVMLLMSNTVTQHGFRSCALWVCTGAAMVGLMGAFASGSCRSLKTSMYLNKFERLDLEQQNQQQSRASEHGNDDAYQILRKSRMYLLLLGILAASVTYQAGLNPPGGFWQGDAAADSRHHYLAGDPILHITYPRRYLAFFYCNATAFVASLVILILLLSNILSTQGIKYCALQVAMILDLFGLIGAYAAGSCRQVSKSVYVSLLVVPVFLYVGIHVVVFMLEVWPARPAWIQALSEKMEQCAPSWLKELFEHPEQGEEEAADVERTLEKRRKLLLLLAILAASLTYQAGMGPPGGFWQESKLGHVAGDPVLNDNYPRRYVAFFYCNATAFVASLAVIMLLVNRKLSAREIRSHALRVCVILDLVGLMGAFAAGSCRKVSTSIYVLVLTFAVLLCIALQVTLVLSETARGLAKRLLSKLGAGEDQAGGDGRHGTGVAAGGARDLWDEKLPKYLLLLAALAAAVTYQAAMSPPGGLWGDTTGHTAGDPVLTSNYPRRYKAFFYCNATSFMASLVIMVLLLIKRVSDTPPALLALHAAMILDLFGLMGAYAAGSCRRVRTSAYILALVVGVSAYIAVLVVASIGIAGRLRSAMDWLTEQVTRCFSVHDM